MKYLSREYAQIVYYMWYMYMYMYMYHMWIKNWTVTRIYDIVKKVKKCSLVVKVFKIWAFGVKGYSIIAESSYFKNLYDQRTFFYLFHMWIVTVSIVCIAASQEFSFRWDDFQLVKFEFSLFKLYHHYSLTNKSTFNLVWYQFNPQHTA